MGNKYKIQSTKLKRRRGTKGVGVTNNGGQIMHCDLLCGGNSIRPLYQSAPGFVISSLPTNKKKIFPFLPLLSQPKYMSLAISITEGFEIPFVLFHSYLELELSFLPGKKGFLFFNPPICQKRVAWKINLSAEVHMLNAISHLSPFHLKCIADGQRESVPRLYSASQMKVRNGGERVAGMHQVLLFTRRRVLTQFLHHFFPTTFSASCPAGQSGVSGRMDELRVSTSRSLTHHHHLQFLFDPLPPSILFFIMTGHHHCRQFLSSTTNFGPSASLF